MNVTRINRMVVAASVGAVVLCGIGVRVDAGPQDGHGQQEGRQDKDQRKARERADKEQAKQQQAQRTQEAVRVQRDRFAQYRDHLEQQRRVAQPQQLQLRDQNRRALAGVQEQYLARLRQQQVQVQARDRYNYRRDPFFSTPATFRYFRSGRSYETNQYGVTMLRQAVNFGYEEGYRVGGADRQDHWDSNYEGSYAYQDANFGYNGLYIDRDDYNAYFREGFRRGYEDGFTGQTQFGTYASGHGTVLGAVLATILNFEAIR